MGKSKDEDSDDAICVSYLNRVDDGGGGSKVKHRWCWRCAVIVILPGTTNINAILSIDLRQNFATAGALPDPVSSQTRNGVLRFCAQAAGSER